MRWIILFLLLTSCVSMVRSVGSAKDAYLISQEFDIKYGTDIHDETLLNIFLDKEKIQMYIDELDLLEKRASPEDWKTANEVLVFINTRKLMLESQRLVLNGLEDQRNCPFLKFQIDNAIETWDNAKRAMKNLVLTAPDFRELFVDPYPRILDWNSLEIEEKYSC